MEGVVTMVRTFKPGVWVLFAAVYVFLIVLLLSTLSAAIAAALAGALWWWVLIERPSKPTFYRGAVFGFLTVILAHGLHGFVAGLLHLPLVAGDVPDGFDIAGPVPSLAELREITSAMLLWTALSLVFVGVFTIPLGIVASLVLVVFRRRVPRWLESR
jgi:hypothetical protein